MTELDQFRREVEAWFKANRPPEPKFLLPESFMEVGSDEQFEFLRDWQRKIYEAGYLGMAWPREYGGGGKPQVYQDIVNAEMARQKVPFVPNTIGLNWAGPLILAIGTEDAKKKYIKGILNADDIWCQGFSEPDQGSDLANSQVSAKRDGNDYVINGSKIWTSLGSYAKYMILLGAHQSAAAALRRPVVLPGADEVAGHRAPADQEADRRVRLHANFLHRRAHSGREPDGQGRRGLEDRDDDADV